MPMRSPTVIMPASSISLTTDMMARKTGFMPMSGNNGLGMTAFNASGFSQSDVINLTGYTKFTLWVRVQAALNTLNLTVSQLSPALAAYGNIVSTTTGALTAGAWTIFTFGVGTSSAGANTFTFHRLSLTTNPTTVSGANHVLLGCDLYAVSV